MLLLPLAVLCSCRSVREARKAQADAAEAAAGRLAAAVDLSREPLEGLVRFATTNRPSMKAAVLALEDARLALREIAADAPILSTTPWNAVHASISSGYSESSRAAQHRDFRARTYRGNLSANLSLDLLLWDFGRNNARARAQGEKVVAAEAALWREGFAVFSETCAAWFALRQNEALLETAATNVVQFREHLAQAEDRFSLGEARQLDVLRARLDLAEAAEAAVAASNDVAVAGARLMAALGIDASAGGWKDVVGERGGALSETERSFDDTFASARGEFEAALETAPAVAVAKANLKAASAQVDRAIADFMPTFSASVALNWTDPLWYWRWALDAAQTIFTGGRKTAALDRAVVAMKSAESDLESAVQELSRAVETAVAERDSAREALAAAETSVAQAAENLDAVRSEYEVGDASRVDFTDAVSSYSAALGARARAFYRGQAAEAALFAVAGRMPVYAERGGKGKKE